MAEYPERLHHKTPGWVESGALFHIRIRAAPEQSVPLTDVRLSDALLEAARRHHRLGHWWCELFLLMPDHVHALVRFPPGPGMIKAVGNWKRGSARFQGGRWQDNFFDHRIRNQREANEKWHYIRRNPVVKGLCAYKDDWSHWWSGTLGGMR